jgi:branched-chain amino acid transport system permease protein
MDAIVIHSLNALLYASVLFLIAGGLSLIYGVMRIVNLAHGNFYALGAYATAWAVGRALGGSQPSLMLYLLLPVGAVAAAALGAIIEPTLLRPLYKRAEEYQLLITFGLLLILEDLLRLIWGPYPLSASSLFEALGSLSIGESIYPTLQPGGHRSRQHRRGGSGRSSTRLFGVCPGDLPEHADGVCTRC